MNGERELVHWFMNDSQEWIVITEYKDWPDIEAAGKMDDELMKKTIPDDKKRRGFNQRLAKYFPGTLRQNPEGYAEAEEVKEGPC